jgi:glycosyltransferase involved in cell wall biosynthesis
LRLLMVTFDPPAGSGGIEGRTMAYAAGLVRRSICVKVAAIGLNEKLSEERYQGTRLVRLPSSVTHIPRTFSTLVRMMNSSAIDTVFFLSGGSTPVGLLTLGYSRLTGRRSGVFFYGRDVLQIRRRPAGGIALAFSILLAGRVATNSRYTASLLPVRPRGRLAIIHPGVDAEISKESPGDVRDEAHPRVLFVGRLVRRKGADLLVSAFSQLKSELPAIQLDIVGDGPEMKSLKALAEELGLGDSVTFHGALYGHELWRRYAEASILVLPSRQSNDDAEGFGTVFLEAGAFGIPSIGTQTGGIPEAIVDGCTGRLVADEDVEGLKDAVKDLLEDPTERLRLGRNAKERVSEFTWESSTNHVLQFLQGENAR